MVIHLQQSQLLFFFPRLFCKKKLQGVEIGPSLSISVIVPLNYKNGENQFNAIYICFAATFFLEIFFKNIFVKYCKVLSTNEKEKWVKKRPCSLLDLLSRIMSSMKIICCEHVTRGSVSMCYDAQNKLLFLKKYFIFLGNTKMQGRRRSYEKVAHIFLMM